MSLGSKVRRYEGKKGAVDIPQSLTSEHRMLLINTIINTWRLQAYVFPLTFPIYIHTRILLYHIQGPYDVGVFHRNVEVYQFFSQDSPQNRFSLPLPKYGDSDNHHHNDNDDTYMMDASDDDMKKRALKSLVPLGK